jgi:DNA gyrase subunit B
MSAIKVRRSDYSSYDSFEEAIQKAFVNCSSNKYRELWIMEGDSAIGGFKRGRDSRFQAGFKLKGNPKNVFGCSLGEILQNAELRELTKHLGCGIGKDFDMKRLKYDRIIIFVDSDIDGWNMVSLLCCYFLLCMPELVKQGKIFRAVGPLYITKDPKHQYMVSKAEYYSVFADNVAKNIKLVDGKNELTVKQLKELITANRDYLDELMPLVHYYTTNNEIIEFAISHRYDRKFAAKLKAKFPELTYNAKTQVIEGSYQKTDQYLEVNDIFYERAMRLEKIISGINDNQIYYKMIDKGVKYPDIVSLGTFFLKNSKYMPPVVKRIKGIGELNSKILWDTTLNPQNRELIQLTIQDIKRELDTVRILHGPDVTLRKKFMEEYNFNRDDIDN